jgi:DNA-binding transcriptional MerR regulator
MARRTSIKSSTRGNVVLMSKSVFCAISGITEGELASWEREDLIAPVRVERVRGRPEALYDREALRRVRVIRTLGEELEVNIPGIGVILHLLDQIDRQG